MPELAKAYEPGPVEERLYDWWMSQNHFVARSESAKKPFSIVIPPPNVTGVLTMGHVLNNTIQDILCRRARLLGREVLWLPGIDHAGLATERRVVEEILAPQKRTREEVGQETFLQMASDWKAKHEQIIVRQLKRLGCSCDWSRYVFTMDEDYSRAVREAFVSLHRQGLIYRGFRMVNWCPASRTALSDEEVVQTPQQSKLYYIKYEVAEEEDVFLEIATTRPETLMGDTGVAVHPSDARYARYIGKHCWRPFPRERIPIVGDDRTDPAFGTGILKVTPAHDRADFEIGRRHNLPVVDIMHPDGRIHCPKVPELNGMERFAARIKAVEMLSAMGLLTREEPYQNNVGFSERGKVPIEPRLSEQWFLRYPKTKEALRVVMNDTIEFHPPHHKRVYANWLENIQDWCISRQIWWGHRIPIWYKGDETRCQIDKPGDGWRQEDDRLDTWASSWLWAYATMDKKTRAKFYPTSVLVTGPDIIFLWVARMIIAGLEFMPGKSDRIRDNIPFKHVVFTGLIRDSKGRKMSKSLGNSPDPLDLIAKYGADGLRFGLMRIAPKGQDIRYDEKQIEEGRNFCNKLWNASRFRAMQGLIYAKPNPSKHELTPFCHHILQKLDALIERVNGAYDAFDINLAASALYEFVWDDFCSRFLEAAKIEFGDKPSPTRQGTLHTFDYVLARVLKLLHPFAPFITEELWRHLDLGVGSIQFGGWPKKTSFKIDPHKAALAQRIYETVDASRGLRGEFLVPNNKAARFILLSDSNIPKAQLALLAPLLNASEISIVKERPARAPMKITPFGDLFLPLEGLIDPEKEKARLQKEIEKTVADCNREEAKLSNETMLNNAPAERVEEWRRILEEAHSRLQRLREQLKLLET